MADNFYSCTKNDVFFSAASCKKRHLFWCSQKNFKPFLCHDGFSTRKDITTLFFISLRTLVKRQITKQPQVKQACHPNDDAMSLQNQVPEVLCFHMRYCIFRNISGQSSKYKKNALNDKWRCSTHLVSMWKHSKPPKVSYLTNK